MKNSLKLLFAIVLVASFLLSACAPPPPPVAKGQLESAEQEAIRSEKISADLEVEMQQLESKSKAKKAELESLKKYQAELEAGK